MAEGDQITGTLAALTREVRGDVLAGDHASGATELQLEDVSDFDPDGGNVRISGTVYGYTEADEDTDTITLFSGLNTATSAGTPVEVWDPGTGDVVTEWVADVIDDVDDSPIQVPVLASLIEFIGEGMREGTGEHVTVTRDADGDWRLTDVQGRPPRAHGPIDAIAYETVGSFWFDPANYPETATAFVECCGSGAGGGGAGNTGAGECAAGSGGGGGGRAWGWVPIKDMDGPVLVTVPAGGSGGPNGSTAPSDGAAASFGGFVSAPGAVAGKSDPGDTSNFNNLTGGDGGSTTGASGTHLLGSAGGSDGLAALTSGSNNLILSPGAGGSSAGGGGGAKTPNSNNSGPGRNGRAPGGGGSGALNRQNQSLQPGGAGARGAVYVQVWA